jgi:uncharacterized protein (TIGR02145 family)
MGSYETTLYRNGDSIPKVIDGVAWTGLTAGAYCEYNNAVSNVATYGRLYNWYAVSDGRNIAPAGWHVPTDDEWKQLEMNLGMSQAQADSMHLRGTIEGGKLKETGTANWDSPNAGATNACGFSALPGGNRRSYGNYVYMGNAASFWSSTQLYSNIAWSRFLWSSESKVDRFGSYTVCGISVRCVRDY